MQSIRSSLLSHVKLRIPTHTRATIRKENVLKQLNCWFCSSTSANPDQIKDRVIELVKKFDKIDASKVTEKADFQKDLNLDSLDRVELVMALEEAFSIEIPDEKADKLTCCLDVANYIISYPKEKTAAAS